MCKLCPLSKNGYCPASGDGQIMLIGQNPGSIELANRLPFTGPCNWIFDYINREHYYVTNVVKCAGDIKLCKYCPEVFDELEARRPLLIVTLGKEAFKRIAKGIWMPGLKYKYNGIPIYATYHPSGNNNVNHEALVKDLVTIDAIAGGIYA